MVARGAPLIALVLGACTPAPAREAAHPSVVSLNPCTDAILAEVADPTQIAGLSSYSSDPASSIGGKRNSAARAIPASVVRRLSAAPTAPLC